MLHTDQDSLQHIAKCWLITLSNDTAIGFTDHDCDLVIDGCTYYAKGAAVSIVAQNSNEEADSFEVKSIIDHDSIRISDVLSGLYDGSKVEMFIVDYKNVARKYWSKVGHITDIAIHGQTITANVKGLTQFFEKHVCESYSENCRAVFGDKKCKVDLSCYSLEVAVKSLDDELQLHFSQPLSIEEYNKHQKYYEHGKVKFKSGKNLNLEIEIAAMQSDRVILMSSVPFEVGNGDIIEIIAGCSKTFTACYKLYNNVINFRGEPHLPSIASVIQ